jgi:hypothetical protein
LDLGQVNDYSALCVNELIERPDGKLEHRCGHLERWRGVPYPAVVRDVAKHVDRVRGGRHPRPFIGPTRYHPDTRPEVILVIDNTGCGRPVSDMFDEANMDCQIVKVSITGGVAVTKSADDSREFHVPKRLLVSTLLVCLQTGRLKIQSTLPLAATLTAEAVNFRATFSPSGHDSYGAASEWREGSHDDLLLATAMACWCGEQRIGQGKFEHASPAMAELFARIGL